MGRVQKVSDMKRAILQVRNQYNLSSEGKFIDYYMAAVREACPDKEIELFEFETGLVWVKIRGDYERQLLPDRTIDKITRLLIARLERHKEKTLAKEKNAYAALLKDLGKKYLVVVITGIGKDYVVCRQYKDRTAVGEGVFYIKKADFFDCDFVNVGHTFRVELIGAEYRDDSNKKEIVGICKRDTPFIMKKEVENLIDKQIAEWKKEIPGFNMKYNVVKMSTNKEIIFVELEDYVEYVRVFGKLAAAIRKKIGFQIIYNAKGATK